MKLPKEPYHEGCMELDGKKKSGVNLVLLAGGKDLMKNGPKSYENQLRHLYCTLKTNCILEYSRIVSSSGADGEHSTHCTEP